MPVSMGKSRPRSKSISANQIREFSSSQSLSESQPYNKKFTEVLTQAKKRITTKPNFYQDYAAKQSILSSKNEIFKIRRLGCT